MTTIMGIRTEESIVEKLDKIAEHLERDRNWVVNEAPKQYLEMHVWRLERIQQGIADTDSGRSITTDELRTRIQSRHQDRTN